MATAKLEMINPYSKYGLRRRPTYEEIIGLIGENETLTGNLPDRRATFFKASPEGSFFDGLDHLEVLKEQQNRIQERQMREMLLRQNGLGTFHLERWLQQNREATPVETETQRDTGLVDASTQAQLQERARQALERAKQTGEAHRSTLPRVPPITRGLLRGGKTFDITQDEPIAQDDVAMLSAMSEGEQPKPEREITYSTNFKRMNAEKIKYQLFLRGVDVDDPERSLETSQRGKRGGLSTKAFYEKLAREMVEDGRWETEIEEQLLRKRIQEYKNKYTARASGT